jgi:NAD(P)-dependent dehydrogenase (short-subunit alcohol dehydrogenase family)
MLADLTRALPQFTDRALPLAGSVAAPEDVERVTEAIESEWGGLDVLVNCAGVSSNFTRSERLDIQDWQQVIDVNLSGAFLCSQAASRLMLPQSAGSIINISSIHGGSGMARLAPYSASKAGLEALTRTLALEWASHGVRVNTVSPGYFVTDMTEDLRRHEGWNARLINRIPMRRFGDPSELVPLVVYLASPASSYVTGANFYIDGGWRAE